MRRVMVCGFIGTYLLMLVFGLFSHALGYKSTDHVGMYFLVWDMYCGWGGYEIRHHIIAEGESGQYYDVTPPWGEFVPFGSAGRHDYDASTSFTAVIAEHVLNHTDHEPMTEIILVEEAWSKKYNLPASIYESRYEEPLEKRSYFRPRVVLSSDGEIRERCLDWTSWLAHQALADNPRLQRDIANRPFMMQDQFSSPEKVRRVNYTTTEDAPE
jgi:hypothetical protein